jgi:ribosome-interacting GTPase 1
MPANLTPMYLEAERAFKEAKTTEEKIPALENMLTVIPKHKGTEHLRADLKTRLAKLRNEVQQKAKNAPKKADIYRIVPEGAAQVIVIGFPNAGKSQLLGAITNATPEVADYPYSTIKPTAGMMRYENVQIQLVDSAPLMNEPTDAWVANLIRSADGILILLDASEDPLGQMELVLDQLREWKIHLLSVKDPASQNIAEEVTPRFLQKWTAIAVNKTESAEAQEQSRLLLANYGEKFPVVAISAQHQMNLEPLRAAIFSSLNILRIYAKSPGKKVETDKPFILPQGANIIDFAGKVHKDFQEKLAYARIWREGVYDGLRVGRNDILADKDIVELHM